MSDKNFKTIRKALHNTTKQILPTVLTMELVTEIRKQLAKQVSDTLAALSKQVTERLDAMEEKQRTMYESYIRNVLAPAQAVPANIQPETPKETNAAAQS